MVASLILSFLCKLLCMLFCAVPHFLRISLVLTFVMCFLCGWFFLSLHGFGGRGQEYTRSTLPVGFVCHYYMASSEVEQVAVVCFCLFLIFMYRSGSTS